MVQREEMYFEPRCVGSDLRIRWYGEQYSAPELERHYEETVYIRVSGKELMVYSMNVVATIHAGLECGLLSGQLPELDCVSFGPNMFDVHSVNEKLEVASVQRMWDYLLAVLKNCR